jgi:exopolysaccharide biosynthesis polyprenyl glycosylphosphotransferase
MLRRFSQRRIIGFFLFDLLGTLSMLMVALYLRAEIGRLPDPITNLMQILQIQLYNFWRDPPVSELLPYPVFILVTVIWPFFLIVFSVYDGRRNPTLAAEILNVFMAVCISTLTLAGILYFSYRETPRVLILIFFILDLFLLVGMRLAWGMLHWQRHRLVNPTRRRVVIIGAGPVGQNVVSELKKFAIADLDLIGYLDDDEDKFGQTFADLPVLGGLDDLISVVTKQRVQDAVIALPLHAHDRLIDICSQLQKLGLHVHVIPDLFALSFPSATLDGFGGIPVIDLGQPGIHGWQRALKRAFDLIAVTIGLILLFPFLLIIGILIKLDSPGPVFYKQTRVGENGRQFQMFKFRSMHTNADPEIHKAHVTRLIKENIGLEKSAGTSASLKMENDPRITRIGKFIRKTSIDELPQLLNVMLGDMSLVGPRPPLLYEVDLYQDWHKRRFEVPPGITGLWQVKGRNLVNFDEMVRMDIEYIEHQSVWLDIKLLLQTPRAVLSARGAG